MDGVADAAIEVGITTTWHIAARKALPTHRPPKMLPPNRQPQQPATTERKT
jgi:hypothetical protein